MENKILFKEEQKQKQKWIWFLLIVLIISTLIGAIQQIIFNKSFGTHPIPDWGFFAILGLLLVLFYFLVKSNLYTEITSNYILFHYKPFYHKPIIIKWENVKNCYIRLYSPIKEYRGWGVKKAFNTKNGKAYNVAGNIGIQLELKNGEKILVGTQKGKEAEIAIRSAFKKI